MKVSKSVTFQATVVEEEDTELIRALINSYSSSQYNSQFIGELLVDGAKARVELMEAEELTKMNPTDILKILDWRGRHRERNQERLNTIIARDESTEEEMDLIHTAAERLDLDEQQAADLAQRPAFASVVASSYNGTKNGRCLRWLAGLLTEHSKGLLRNEVMRLGAEDGYHESMVNRCSRQLNVVKVKGDGGNWYWHPAPAVRRIPPEEKLPEVF